MNKNDGHITHARGVFNYPDVVLYLFMALIVIFTLEICSIFLYDRGFARSISSLTLRAWINPSTFISCDWSVGLQGMSHSWTLLKDLKVWSGTLQRELLTTLGTSSLHIHLLSDHHGAHYSIWLGIGVPSQFVFGLCVSGNYQPGVYRSLGAILSSLDFSWFGIELVLFEACSIKNRYHLEVLFADILFLFFHVHSIRTLLVESLFIDLSLL